MYSSVSFKALLRAFFFALLLLCGISAAVSSPALAVSPPSVEVAASIAEAPVETATVSPATADLALFVAVAPTVVATNAWPWPHNGCTYAPDNIYGSSILDACNRHDGCYVMHWSSRATCDSWFLSDLQKVCRQFPFYLAGGCNASAYTYYVAVRTFGGYFYNANSYDVRMNTRMA